MSDDQSPDRDSDDGVDASPADAVAEPTPEPAEPAEPAEVDPVAAARFEYRTALREFFATSAKDHRPGQWDEVQELRTAFRNATRRR